MPINNNAQDHLSAGIFSYTRWRADAMVHIDAAVEADNNAALPRLIKAWVLQSARDANFTQQITQLADDAKRCISSGDRYEHDLLSALNLGRAGRNVESATLLEAILHNDPCNLLVHQLLHESLFWMGSASWMKDVTDRAAPTWQETSDDFGQFLSLRAFASEEAGCLDDAERFARQALEIDSSDIWSAHALAHSLYMKGDNAQGIDLIEKLSPNWGQANQMRHHMWWHMCLYLLEQGDHERIFQLLTTEVRNPESELVKESPAASIDIQNVASLLFRLELYGVDVGEHWQVLAPICANRVSNHENAYGNTHDMMVLLATGQDTAASDLLRNMRDACKGQSNTVALSYNAIAIPVCEALIAHHNKDYQQVLALLGGIRHHLNLMGASHAQRDIFYHLLVRASEQEGREDLRAVFIRDIERLGFSGVPERAAYRR